MKNFEQLVSEILRECEKEGEPVTREEAEEMARMEIGSKDISREARSVPPEKEKRQRTIKVSPEKQQLFLNILDFLNNSYENVTILNNNKLISVKIGNKTFKIDIIEQKK